MMLNNSPGGSGTSILYPELVLLEKLIDCNKSSWWIRGTSNALQIKLLFFVVVVFLLSKSVLIFIKKFKDVVDASYYK